MRLPLSRLAIVIAAAPALSCAARVAPPPVTACPAVAARRWHTGGMPAPRILRVWIDESSQPFEGWSTYGRQRLTQAINRWNAVGLPVRMALAESPREVEVVVNVVDTLPPQPETRATDQGGLTVVTYRPGGGIARAHVFVAVRARYGARYRLSEQQATLLHELGHALGLPHATGPRSLMSERRFGSTLTGTDIALARATYPDSPCAPAGGAVPPAR